MPSFHFTDFAQFAVDWLADHPVAYLLLVFCGLYLAARCVRVVRDEQQREQDAWDAQQIARYRASLRLFEQIRNVRKGQP